MVKIFVQPRTLTLTAAAHVPVDVIEASGTVIGGRFEVHSIVHDEPPLQLDAEEAVSYLYDNYDWTIEDANDILSALRVGDQMIPDEDLAREERLVRVS